MTQRIKRHTNIKDVELGEVLLDSREYKYVHCSVCSTSLYGNTKHALNCHACGELIGDRCRIVTARDAYILTKISRWPWLFIKTKWWTPLQQNSESLQLSMAPDAVESTYLPERLK